MVVQSPTAKIIHVKFEIIDKTYNAHRKHTEWFIEKRQSYAGYFKKDLRTLKTYNSYSDNLKNQLRCHFKGKFIKFTSSSTKFSHQYYS